MLNNIVDKKKRNLTIRVSETQMKSIEIAKGGGARISNTDVLMSGVNLLRILIQKNKQGDKSYDELLNALIIRDDILRCMEKAENPCIDNVITEKANSESLEKNEKEIVFYLRNIVNKC